MALAQRLLLLLTQLALLLPFVLVADCEGDDGEVFTGLGVYSDANEALVFLGVPAVLALMLGLWAWRPGTRPRATAPGLGLRSLACTLALAVCFLGPSLAHMFHTVRPQVGMVLQLTAWGILGLGYLAGGVHALVQQVDGTAATAEARGGVALVLLGPLVSSVSAYAIGSDNWMGPLVLLAAAGPAVCVLLLGVGRRVKRGDARLRHWKALLIVLFTGWMISCLGLGLP